MPKSKRCSHHDCKKKLSLTDTLTGHCKCLKMFCPLHRAPETHNCTFDRHSFEKNNLAKVLEEGKCICKKIESC